MKLKCIIVFLLIFTINPILSAQEKKTGTKQVINNGIDRPKLVIGLVIDQMRWDYLYRYYNLYADNGFKRLLKNGFSFENTHVPYATAVTAAGHATLYTGSLPAIHGIVGNDWEERDSSHSIYCTSDKSVSSVGTTSRQGRMSPRNMFTTTIGDELRLATNFKSRVFGIAFKDRGGILPAGHSANAAYWFDDSTGNWITSSYYMDQLPAWVNKFNRNRKIDSLMSNDWNLLYDVSKYDQSTADANEYEKPFKHEKQATFPHIYKDQISRNYYAVRESPYGNTLTLDFAKAMLNDERLGKTGQTDMLCISLSSPDFIGHKVGTHSLEIQDTYLRLDKDIESFLTYLDKTIGDGQYLLFLSADHGAPQAPAFMKANKLPAGSLKKSEVKKSLNAHCLKQFGADGLVKAIHEYQVYINHQLVDSLHLDLAAVKKSMVNFLLKKWEVIAAFDYDQFDKVVLPAKTKAVFANGYNLKRSGDIQYVLKSQYNDNDLSGTEHGVMYAYDSHIPLIWYGWKIKPGKTNREAYMTDVAPTISALLKIQMPGGSVGQVLREVVE